MIDTPHKRVNDIVIRRVEEGLCDGGKTIELQCGLAWKEVQKEVPECTLHIFCDYWLQAYRYQARL